MTTRSLAWTLGLASFALLCLADGASGDPQSRDRGQAPASRPSAPSRPAPAPSRPAPQAPSRPSAAPSRPSNPTPAPSRPSAAPTQRGNDRGSVAPSRPAPTPAPAQPRYEPRPSAPESPRYEPPRPVTPRVDPGRGSDDAGRGYATPESPRVGGRTDSGDTRRREAPTTRPADGGGSNDGGGSVDAGRQSPRYLPPDNSGRVYDNGRRASDSRNGSGDATAGPGVGRSNGGNARVGDDTGSRSGSDARSANDNGRVWREGRTTNDPIDNLSFERRAPRTPIPVLSGSVDRGTARDTRPGLSERTGRVAGEGPARARDVNIGEGLVRVPQPTITRDSILQRYRAPAADARGATASVDLGARSPRGDGKGDLSSARMGNTRGNGSPLATDSALDARRANAADGGTRTREVAPARGTDEARRREREGVDKIETLRRVDPDRARSIENRGRDTSRVVNDATNYSVGVAVGAVTGIYSGWFFDPTCSPPSSNSHSGGHGKANWHAYWNSCWGSSWWWNYGYGFYWSNGNWGFSWAYPYSYAYRPWSYYSCGYPSYSYGYDSPCYWSPSPVTYTTIIYQDDESEGRSVVYEEPAPRVEGEGVIAEPAGRVVGEGAAPPSAAPEVKSSLVRGAVQYLELGDEAFRSGRYADAVHHYARAVEYAPEDGVLYLILSDALFATGDYHYAAFALRRSLELEPTLLENIVDKHGFYGDAVEFDRQIELAEKYLDEHFLDDDARLVLGANYLFANRPAQCADLMLSAFSRSVRETPAGTLILERAQKLREAGATNSGSGR